MVMLRIPLEYRNGPSGGVMIKSLSNLPVAAVPVAMCRSRVIGVNVPPAFAALHRPNSKVQLSDAVVTP